MKEPVYLISSFRRSGSSMMARCLEGGGMNVLKYDGNDHQFNIPFGDSTYIPNPNGFFSIEGYLDFGTPSFYEDNKGRVLKVPRMWLSATGKENNDATRLPDGRYKLIMMVRDQEEILASYRSFIPLRHWGMVEVSVHLMDLIKNATYDVLNNRGDFEILEINYKDVIEKPLEIFHRIKDFGFPIDPELAANLVDSSLYRHRKN